MTPLKFFGVTLRKPKRGKASGASFGAKKRSEAN